MREWGRWQRVAAGALMTASVLGCRPSGSTVVTEPAERSSSEDAATVRLCPLPQMVERRFALQGGPTTCDNYEERCNRECMRGDARHCHLLGVGYLEPYMRRGRVARPANHELATELLLRGCQLGLPESCVEWARAIGRTRSVDTCQRPVMARACMLDVAAGCVAAGAYAAEAGQPAEAGVFELQACELGAYDACARVAEATDATPLADVETLRRVLFSACFRAQHLRSCVRLAEALEHGPSATATQGEADVVWEQACRLDRQYCSRLPPPVSASVGAPAGATPASSSPARGSLSAETIRTVVRANLGSVRSCYEAALSRSSRLRGTVTVRFIIESDGTVLTATVAGDTVGDAALASCVSAAVMTWRFPPPDGGGLVSVTYPFTLET